MQTQETTIDQSILPDLGLVDVAGLTSDGLERLLVSCERSISSLRHLQSRIVAEADRRNLPKVDGARSLAEWVSSRTDVSSETAFGLGTIASNLDCQNLLADGVSFDRTVRVSKTGQADPLWHLDLAGVARVAGRHRHLTRQQEHSAHTGRYLSIQPELDHTRWRIHGQLPATDGAVIAQALDARADQIALDTGSTESRSARRVDALAAICQDTLGSSDAGGSGSNSGSTVTVIVDARHATHTNGETGAWVVSGPRIGPATLERLLCESTVEVTAITEDGTPLAIGSASTSIPPRTRRFVLARDGGCVIDGCRSVYRLQPHHVLPRSRGGDNHPNNLATLCWYHHHTVVHGQGFTLDPDTPLTRRRLLPPTGGPSPTPGGHDPP